MKSLKTLLNQIAILIFKGGIYIYILIISPREKSKIVLRFLKWL
jgi:hypothetical protein